MSGALFIGGAWRTGAGAALATLDPASGETVWRGAAADAAQTAAAMQAAQDAFPAWARTPLETRIGLARAFAAAAEARGPELAQAISQAMGKPLWEAKGEVATVIGKVEISIRMQSERAGARTEPTAFGALSLDHHPHGALAVFGPFNFPAHLPNGHIVPALLAGNTIVFKPSELAPLPGIILAQAWEAAGLPAGVFNLVQGGREIGEALLAAPGLAGVLFTGSVGVGLAIHRRFAGRPDVLLALEMGGNNPLIVWPAADPAAAANLIAHSAWATTGQRCSCARRLIVPDTAFGEEVLERTADLARTLVVGPWNADPAPFMGPLASAHFARQAEAAERSLQALGGRSLRTLDRDGAFVRPALIDMTQAQEPSDEEIFAPLLQVFRTPSLEAAFERAGRTRFGLSAGLVCDDPGVWTRARAALRAGVLNWNRPTTGASSAAPFGGPGLSGNLRPSAAYAADYAAYPVATQSAPVAQALPAPGLP